jgi:hypothetical protein
VHLVKKRKKEKRKNGKQKHNNRTFPRRVRSARISSRGRLSHVYSCFPLPCTTYFGITRHTAPPLFRASFPSYSPHSFFTLVMSIVVTLLAPLFNFALLFGLC